LTFLASFFKSPLGTDENDFAAQFKMLTDWAEKNSWSSSRKAQSRNAQSKNAQLMARLRWETATRFSTAIAGTRTNQAYPVEVSQQKTKECTF